MKPFSKAILKLGTESAFAVGPEIAYWEKKGFDIIKLNIGEPSASIIPSATKAALQSFKKHETHYTPSAGNYQLRKNLAKYMSITRKVDYQAEDIIITPGGKPVIAGAILILVNPQDEVIYPTPSYPIYESMIDFVSAKKRPILLREENGFVFDLNELKKIVSKKTKLLILNSPSNPTGGVIKEKDLKVIAQLAKKYDFYILSDEIYSRIVYGESFRKVVFNKNRFSIAPSIASLPGMAERVIILDGFSKTYAMTGLRLGFACSKNKEFMAKFLTYAINIWSCLPQPCMSAAETALKANQTEIQKEFALYQKKRDFTVEFLNQIKGIRCYKPEGAFYLFPNVTQVCQRLGLKDAEELRKYLLIYDKKNKKGVAVLARKHFGQLLKEEKEEYLRLSFAGSYQQLKEGIKRIKEALDVH